METQPNLVPDQDINFHINFRLLREVLRRKGLIIALCGLAAGTAYGLRQLYVVPQQFGSECSVVMQTNASPGIASGLSALLSGGGGGSHKYMGLLASRMMAEKVERRVNLTRKLNLGDKRVALNLLRAGLKADDASFEGLLLIHFQLEAPPPLAPGARAKSEQARVLVADVANAYAAELSKFYSESNSEGANALLEIAENERQNARRNYELATSRLRNFVASWQKLPVQSTPLGNNVESNGPGDLLNLYNQIGQIDADIVSTRVAQEATKKLRDEQLQNIRSLPAEDALLNSARMGVTQAELNLKHVSDTYGVDHPSYKEAVDNLRRAKEELTRQEVGLRKMQTTDQMDLRKNMVVQTNKRATLMKQIATSENQLFSRRNLSWRMEQLRAAQGIALQLMQAAEVKAVEVRLSTLTGKSKMTVLDKALPPDTNMQGNASPTRMSVIMAILAMIGVTILEYMRAIRREALNAFQFAMSTAGLMGNGVTLPNDAVVHTNGIHPIAEEPTPVHVESAVSGNGHANGNGYVAANGANGRSTNGHSANGNGSKSNGTNGNKSSTNRTNRRQR